MDYFISDIHFGHREVIKFCERPFRTVSQMNDSIIENWNSLVSDCDRVFVVGDVFICDPRDAKVCVESLNGYKVLIKGNHDLGKKDMLYMGFDQYYKKYDYKMPDGRLALLQHYPAPDIILDKKYDLMIHGHIHIDDKVNGKKINVSADIWNYTPVDVETLNSLSQEPSRKDEFLNVSIDNEGMLAIDCKIRMEDFSGAADYVYKEMSKKYSNRRKK